MSEDKKINNNKEKKVDNAELLKYFQKNKKTGFLRCTGSNTSNNLTLLEAKEIVNSLKVDMNYPLGLANLMCESDTYEIWDEPDVVRNNLFFYEGKYSGCNVKEGYFKIDIYKFFPVEETTFSDSCSLSYNDYEYPIKLDTELFVLGLRTENCFEIVPYCVIRKDEECFFEMVRELYAKVVIIKLYYTFFSRKGKRIEYRKKRYIEEHIVHGYKKKYRRFVPAYFDVNFTTRQEQMVRFCMTRELFPYDTQRMFERCFREAKEGNSMAEKRLYYLSRIIPTDIEHRFPLDDEKLMYTLDERLYGMKKAKSILLDIINSSGGVHPRGMNVLILGEAGVGKTSLLESFVYADRAYGDICKLSGLSEPHILEGTENTDVGWFVRLFSELSSTDHVIGLDDLDEMGVSAEGDPMRVIYSILKGEFKDRFLECSILTDNTIFLATAKDPNKISADVFSLFGVIIQLDKYSDDDKMVIAKEYLVPQIKSRFSIGNDLEDKMAAFTDKEVLFSDDEFRYVIQNYCQDAGVRNLEYSLEKLVRYAIRYGSKSKGRLFSTEKIRDVLEATVYRSKNNLQ